nr:hypothetical protein [uncultured Rhodopila sp.]
MDRVASCADVRTATEAEIASEFWANEDVVVKGHKIREDMLEASLPRFGESRWDCSPIVHRLNSDKRVILFNDFEDPRLLVTAKEYAAFQLDLVGRGEQGYSVGSIIRMVGCIRDLFAFMETRSIQLADLTQQDCDIWVRYLGLKGLTAENIAVHIMAVRSLCEAGDFLTYGRVTFRPWGLKSASKIAKADTSRRENKTPRIQESVMAPLLRWALLYVEVLSTNIIAACQEWQGRGSFENVVKSTSRRSRDDVSRILEDYVAELRASGRCLPGKDCGGPGFLDSRIS